MSVSEAKMGVSFKVARNGTRYRPKPGVDESNNLEGDNGGLDATDLQQRSHQVCGCICGCVLVYCCSG